MPRHPDSGQLDIPSIFRRVQSKMLADLNLVSVFEHACANGTAAEQQWLALFDNYLPKRYRAASAFIINSSGRRSRQIDIAIYDNFFSPPLFPHTAGVHIPIESVYAIFEVKPTISRQWLRDAGAKAASVRELQAGRDILAGILAASSVWTPTTFPISLGPALADLPPEHKIDIGCALEHGSFEFAPSLTISEQDETLIFFILRLIDRLNHLGPAPPADLMSYGAELVSFKKRST